MFCLALFKALSGVGEFMNDVAQVLENTSLDAALNAQFLFQIGIVTAVPMILGFILEQGFLRVCLSFVCVRMNFGKFQISTYLTLSFI